MSSEANCSKMAECDNCNFTYYEFIVKFFNNNEESVKFLRSHGILPKEVICPNCNEPCVYREDRQRWRCRKTYLNPKIHKLSSWKKV